jgi:ABC-2 type transport system ATP-binding protein
MHDPSLLLLDEPTVGLDVQSRAAIFASLRLLRQRGCALVFTTHHLEEAELLCDRIGILDRGQLIALGTLAELDAAMPEQDGALRIWRADPAHAAAGPCGARLEHVFLELTGRSLRDA